MTAPENAIIKHGHAEYAALCEDTALSMNVYCAVSVGTCTYDIMTTPEVFAAVAKRLEPQWAICRNWKADGERFKAHRSLMPYFSDSIEVETWHHDEALEAVESLQARATDLQHDPKADSRVVINEWKAKAETAWCYADHLREQMVESEAQVRAARTELGILRPMVGRLQESNGLARIAREAARPLGWAVGTHGTLVRDLDLIAVPWRDDAEPQAVLIEAIAAAIKYEVFGGDARPRPGGRWSILLKHPAATFQQTEKGTWTPQAIDLSIADPRRVISGDASPLPCPICTMPLEEDDGGCIRHAPDEHAALKAEVERLREDVARVRKLASEDAMKLQSERDAANARAEKLKVENEAVVNAMNHNADIANTARAAHAEAKELLRNAENIEGNARECREWFDARDAHLAKYGKDASK